MVRRALPLLYLVACGSGGNAMPGASTDGGPGDGTAESGGDASADVATDGPGDESLDASSDAIADASGDALGDAGMPQAVAVPLYVDPSMSPSTWSQLHGAAPVVALLVANPASGPGATVDSSYTQAISATHTAGQTIVGYVHTSYGMRPIADVEADVDAWYTFYPAIDGIFYDEASADTGTIAGYYQPIHDYVKGKKGARTVIINPGTLVAEAFMATADIVVTFEDVYANYVSNYPPNPAWIANYPRWRFWHLVLSATSVSDMQNAVTIARGRNVGYVYVTDQGPATAYSQIVTGAYWQAELTAAQK